MPTSRHAPTRAPEIKLIQPFLLFLVSVLYLSRQVSNPWYVPCCERTYRSGNATRPRPQPISRTSLSRRIWP
jgi:hypothetical protein